MVLGREFPIIRCLGVVFGGGARVYFLNILVFRGGVWGTIAQVHVIIVSVLRGGARGWCSGSILNFLCLGLLLFFSGGMPGSFLNVSMLKGGGWVGCSALFNNVSYELAVIKGGKLCHFMRCYAMLG